MNQNNSTSEINLAWKGAVSDRTVDVQKNNSKDSKTSDVIAVPLKQSQFEGFHNSEMANEQNNTHPDPISNVNTLISLIIRMVSN